jgi:hypothetical protein
LTTAASSFAVRGLNKPGVAEFAGPGRAFLLEIFDYFFGCSRWAIECKVDRKTI